MDLSIPSERGNASRPNISPKIIAGIVLAILLLSSFDILNKGTRSSEQLKFESWLSQASLELRSGTDIKVFPELSLKLIGESAGENQREMHLTASFDLDSRERVIRILELVREAQLFEVRRADGATPQPGDLVLHISSPEKSFSLLVPKDSIKGNVKAGLLLKLFEEFSKIPVNTMARMSEETAKIESDLSHELEAGRISSVDPIINDGMALPGEVIIDDDLRGHGADK